MVLGQAAELFIEIALFVGFCSLLPLSASMAVGLIVAVLQAATQVQEQSLTFLAKLLMVAGVFAIFGPDMAEQLRQLTVEYLRGAEMIAR